MPSGERNPLGINGTPLDMTDSSYAPTEEDARRTRFLVGDLTKKVQDQIGGCPWATTLTAWSDHFDSDIVVAMPCKRWGCRHCGPIKCAMLSNNIARAEPTKFITLTTDAKLWEDGRKAYDGIRRKLPKWTARMRKIVGTFEYVRVLELHQNGMPHWHLMARCSFIKQADISKAWAELTGSPIVDIRSVAKIKNTARYVAKYLTKCKYIQWTDRRVSWSRKFFPPMDEKQKDNWKLRLKHHDLDPPHKVMQDQYWGMECQRIGKYAWKVAPMQKAR